MTSLQLRVSPWPLQMTTLLQQPLHQRLQSLLRSLLMGRLALWACLVGLLEAAHWQPVPLQMAQCMQVH